jgi:hypothetical protein
MAEDFSNRFIDSTTPSATPLVERCVVGTIAVPIRSPDEASSATACVNVPPTSIPILTRRPTARRGFDRTDVRARVFIRRTGELKA